MPRKKLEPMSDAEFELYQQAVARAAELGHPGIPALRGPRGFLPRYIELTYQRLADVRAGEWRPRSGDRYVKAVAAWLYEHSRVAPTKEASDDLREMVAALGDAAWTYAVHHAHLADSSVLEAARKVSFLEPGLHVAPFRSWNGRPVILAIDKSRSLGLLAEVTGAAGTEFETADDGSVTPINAGEPIVSGRAFDRYTHPILDAGVHVAPWCPWEDERGVCLIAIDSRGRLVTRMDIGPADDLLAARQALGSRLARVQPEPKAEAWQDRYDVEDDDPRSDTLGEEWKG